MLVKASNALSRAGAGLLLLLAATTQSPASPTLVFAASSLKTALDEIAQTYTAETDRQVAISYAGSQIVARQILQGAPAEIVITADEAWMDELEEHGTLEPSTRRVLLGNRLVVIAPTGSGSEVSSLTGIADGLDKDGLLAIANPRAVPAGRYARAALETAGTWNSVSERTTESASVRIALALVAAGEAPIGIVYQSDAGAEPSVRVLLEVPEDLHPPIRYPAAAVKGVTPAALEFLDFLGSDAAEAIFRDNGFAAPVPLPEPAAENG